LHCDLGFHCADLELREHQQGRDLKWLGFYAAAAVAGPCAALLPCAARLLLAGPLPTAEEGQGWTLETRAARRNRQKQTGRSGTEAGSARGLCQSDSKALNMVTAQLLGKGTDLASTMPPATARWAFRGRHCFDYCQALNQTNRRAPLQETASAPASTALGVALPLLHLPLAVESLRHGAAAAVAVGAELQRSFLCPWQRGC